MKRVIKSFLLLLLMLPWVNVTAFGADETFSDVSEDNKFYEYIKQVSDDEIVNGYSDGTYRPAESITRGQFAKMIFKSLGMSVYDHCGGFKDVDKSHVFYNYIASLKCYEFINGYSDGNFGPDDTITRAQVAKILLYIGRTVDTTNFPLTRGIQLYDDVSFDNKMFYYIDSVVSVELEDGTRVMNGYSNGRFGPDDKITREQIAKVIVNFRNYLIDGGSYRPVLTKYFDDYTDEVVEGTATDDDKFVVKGEYNITEKLNKSVIDKSDHFSQEEYGLHKTIWESFANVIPFELSKLVNKMVLIDEHEGIAAGVTRNFGGDIDKFVLIINKEVLDNGKMSSWDSVHESAHLLTISSTQVRINPNLFSSFTQEEFDRILEKEEKECGTYFVLNGCANNSSYIYKFYNEFWEDKIEEFNLVRDSESMSERKDFYLKYNDQFVSTYAMFNPAEDIAETFTYFIYYDKPEDNKSTVNQKLNFFYKYPELIKLRSEIRKRIEAQ